MGRRPANQPDGHNFLLQPSLPASPTNPAPQLSLSPPPRLSLSLCWPLSHLYCHHQDDSGYRKEEGRGGRRREEGRIEEHKNDIERLFFNCSHCITMFLYSSHCIANWLQRTDSCDNRFTRALHITQFSHVAQRVRQFFVLGVESALFVIIFLFIYRPKTVNRRWRRWNYRVPGENSNEELQKVSRTNAQICSKHRLGGQVVTAHASSATWPSHISGPGTSLPETCRCWARTTIGRPGVGKPEMWVGENVSLIQDFHLCVAARNLSE